MKTGADIAFSSDISGAMNAAKTEEELLAAAEPKEKSLNTTPAEALCLFRLEGNLPHTLPVWLQAAAPLRVLPQSCSSLFFCI